MVIVLEALDTEKLLVILEREHWTGRDGYSVRGMWAALIAGVLHNCKSLAEVVRLLEGNQAVRIVCGFPGKDEIPSDDALGRFLKKLVKHKDILEECFEALVEKGRKLLPGFGKKLVADSTDIVAYAGTLWVGTAPTRQTTMLAGGPKDMVTQNHRKRRAKRVKNGICTIGLVTSCTC